MTADRCSTGPRPGPCWTCTGSCRPRRAPNPWRRRCAGWAGPALAQGVVQRVRGRTHLRRAVPDIRRAGLALRPVHPSGGRPADRRTRPGRPRLHRRGLRPGHRRTPPRGPRGQDVHPSVTCHRTAPKLLTRPHIRSARPQVPSRHDHRPSHGSELLRAAASDHLTRARILTSGEASIRPACDATGASSTAAASPPTAPTPKAGSLQPSRRTGTPLTTARLSRTRCCRRSSTAHPAAHRRPGQ